MVVRNSPWSRQFFREWMDHPDALIGAPDQWTFDALYDAHADAGWRAKIAVHPATAFNSEPPFYGTFRGPQQQPVVHLMGDLNAVRDAVFNSWLAGLCTRMAAAAGRPCEPRCAPSGGELDWPVDARRTLDRFTAAYAAISDDRALQPGDRVSALNRLGMVMHHEGRLGERAELVRRGLEIKEGLFGAESPQLTHEVQVLANTLSAIGRNEEALPLMQRALRLAEASRNPKGEPMPHIVAAALGDLGSLYGRLGRYGEAMEMFSRSLEIEEKLWGRGNRHSGDTLHNMGLLEALRGRPAEALVFYERSLAALRKHVAEDHPSVQRARAGIEKLKGKATP